MNAFAETKTPPPQTRSVICPFCSTSMNPSYQLNGYDVVKCSDCGSFTVEPMPSERELGQYYQGFLFQADPGNLDRLRTKAMERWLRRYSRGPDCRMLDIGGGGGFFSRVFQDFGLGSATYLDIDTAACSFARLQLGLEEVLNIPLEEFQRREDTPRFDFIYCRHVLEHLADPLKLARDACALLKPGGALVLQCPNATSVEGILQPTRWRHYRRILADSNRRSSMWAQW